MSLWSGKGRKPSSAVSRYPDHDALVVPNDLVVVNENLRQDLKESLGRDVFFTASNELSAPFLIAKIAGTPIFEIFEI